MKDLNKIKKVLVILVQGGIGDVILSTPILETLYKQLNLNNLTFLLKPYTYDLIKGNPYVDEIILTADNWGRQKNFFQLLREIKKGKFDLVIHLWSNHRFAWLTRLANIPLRVGHSHRLLYSFLFTHKVTPRPLRGDVNSHWVDCLMDYVRILGIPPLPPHLFLPLEPSIKVKVISKLEKEGVKENTLLIGLHPTRELEIGKIRWPRTLFSRLADELVKLTGGGKVAFTGTNKDRALIEEIINNSLYSHINFAGKTTLSELIALIDRCNYFISMDSGPMHIAAARGVPTIGIFQLKSDLPARWHPFGVPYRIIKKTVNCKRKCIKEKCYDFSCLFELTPYDILKEFSSLKEEVAQNAFTVSKCNNS